MCVLLVWSILNRVNVTTPVGGSGEPAEQHVTKGFSKRNFAPHMSSFQQCCQQVLIALLRMSSSRPQEFFQKIRVAEIWEGATLIAALLAYSLS